MTDQVPVSVVIPTVGRPELVALALESLGRCDPRAAEVLVVDQSADRSVSDVVGRFSHVRARLELSRLYERYWREQARFTASICAAGTSGSSASSCATRPTGFCTCCGLPVAAPARRLLLLVQGVARQLFRRSST
jgi:hypothetical protein